MRLLCRGRRSDSASLGNPSLGKQSASNCAEAPTISSLRIPEIGTGLGDILPYSGKHSGKPQPNPSYWNESSPKLSAGLQCHVWLITKQEVPGSDLGAIRNLFIQICLSSILLPSKTRMLEGAGRSLGHILVLREDPWGNIYIYIYVVCARESPRWLLAGPLPSGVPFQSPSEGFFFFLRFRKCNPSIFSKAQTRTLVCLRHPRVPTFYSRAPWKQLSTAHPSRGLTLKTVPVIERLSH